VVKQVSVRWSLLSLVAYVLYYCVANWLSYWVPGSRQLRPLLAHSFASGISRRAVLNRFASFRRDLSLGARGSIGERCWIGSGTSIGDRVRMGPGCRLITGDHPVPPDGETFDVMKPVVRPITVEDDCFIGAGVILLPGVSVGRGATIGAGSVVTRDVPPGAIVAGNPARLIRERRPPVAR